MKDKKPNSVLIFTAVLVVFFIFIFFLAWLKMQRDLDARPVGAVEAVKPPRMSNVPHDQARVNMPSIVGHEFCYEGYVYVWFPSIGVSPKMITYGNHSRAETCPKE